MTTHEQKVLSECKRLESQGLHRQALDLLAEAISSTPSGELFYQRGERYQDLREFDAAFEDYSMAIQLAPTSRRYWVARGQLLYNYLERIPAAIDDFDEAMSAEPSSPVPHWHLCLCYLLLDNLDSAIEHANRALQLDATDPFSHYCIAKCHLAAGDLSSALEEFQIAANLAPNDALYWNALARLFEKSGRTLDALECYQRAADVGPSAMTHIALAGIQLELGNPDAAIACLRSAKTFQMDEGEELLIECYMARANTNKTERTG